MSTEDALRLLRGGLDGVRRWNAWRKADRTIPIPSLKEVEFEKAELSGANFREADLRGANLIRAWLVSANLRRADLRGANLRGAWLEESYLNGAKLRRANLREAHLMVAKLRKANLVEAVLEEADLRGAHFDDANLRGAKLGCANLKGAHLGGANLGGAELRGANVGEGDLRGAHFQHADFTDADLSNATFTDSNPAGANFTNADLTNVRLIRLDLTGCRFDNAFVKDVQVHELRGLPIPPTVLRIGNGPDDILTGDDAANFFVLPAIVEVFLTQPLTDYEMGTYFLHLGEVRARQVAPDVYLVGQRTTAGGEFILRFQGPTYEAIYDALPILLKPFPQAEAIDWQKTLEAIPAEQRTDALTALAKRTAELSKDGRWTVAENLAEMFESYRNARVYRIKEGRSRGLRIDIYTNPDVAARLTRSAPTKELASSLTIYNDQRGTHVGDNINVGRDAIGSNLGRGSLTAEQIVTNVRNSVADSQLGDDLKAVFAQALQALEAFAASDKVKAKAAQTVEEIKAEAEQPEPDKGLIRGLLDSLAAFAKPVAEILEAGLKIGSVVTGS